MIIFRIISLLLIAVALMFLGHDAIGWLEAGGDFAPTSLSSAVDIFMGEGTGAGWVAGAPEAIQNPGVQTLMDAPSWASVGVLGLILALLFRRRDY